MLQETTHNHNLKTINILLVDDNSTDLLLTQSHIEKIHNTTITTAESISTTETLLKEQAFDAILLDLCLPDAIGLEGLIKLRRLVPEMPIVVLTGVNDEELGIMALQRGAQDYLIKGKENARIAQAVQFAIERKRANPVLQSPDQPKTINEKPLYYTPDKTFSAQSLPVDNILTERELQVMKLVGKGYNNKEIADVLVVSIATVKTHVSNILQKLRVSDRTKAVVEAFKIGLI